MYKFVVKELITCTLIKSKDLNKVSKYHPALKGYVIRESSYFYVLIRIFSEKTPAYEIIGRRDVVCHVKLDCKITFCTIQSADRFI